MIPGDHTYRNKYANKENVVPAIGGFIIQGKRNNVGGQGQHTSKTMNKANNCKCE